MVQKLPSQYIDNLLDEGFAENKKYFANASYSGYTVTISDQESVLGEKDAAAPEDGFESVAFQVTVALKERESAYKPEKKDKPAADDTEEAAE